MTIASRSHPAVSDREIGTNVKTYRHYDIVVQSVRYLILHVFQNFMTIVYVFFLRYVIELPYHFSITKEVDIIISMLHTMKTDYLIRPNVKT